MQFVSHLSHRLTMGPAPWWRRRDRCPSHNVHRWPSEMDEIGVVHRAVSLPPFLFCSTADDSALAAEVVSRGNDELAAYVGPHHC